MKLMAMTIGGIDFNSLFRLSSDVNMNGKTSEIPFLEATYFVWILFLIMMPILLSNLLVRIVVDGEFTCNSLKEDVCNNFSKFLMLIKCIDEILKPIYLNGLY